MKDYYVENKDGEELLNCLKRRLNEIEIKRHSIRELLKADTRKFFSVPEIAKALNESTGIVLQGVEDMKKDGEVIEKKVRVQRKKNFLKVPFYSYKRRV